MHLCRRMRVGAISCISAGACVWEATALTAVRVDDAVCDAVAVLEAVTVGVGVTPSH